MGKSARASGIKKNKQGLKKRVFGPVESARNERLNAKLLQLAQQPKPPRPEMEVEEDGDLRDADAEGKDKAEGDQDMEIEGAPKTNVKSTTKTSRPTSSRRQDRLHEAKKSGRVQKHRRERNRLTFAKHPMKEKKKPRK